MTFYPYNPGLYQRMQTAVPGEQVDRGFIAHLYWPDAPAADTDAVHAAITASATAATAVSTGFTAPDVPRSITATAGGIAGDIAAVRVTVSGVNFLDEEIEELLPAFTENTAGTVEGAKAFKRVTGISIPAMDGEGVTVTIGFGNKLGIPYPLMHDTVLAAYLGDAKETSTPTIAVSAENIELNTVKLASALDGSDVDIYLIV